MTGDRRFVIVQTASPGDVVLTLPLVQTLRRELPDSYLGFVLRPDAANLLQNHPAVSKILVYDKRGADRGASGVRRFAQRLRECHFDAALVPQRFLRSALVVRLARIPRRIGFSASAGKMFFSDVVPYDPAAHEIDRNLSLLVPLGFRGEASPFPSLFPDARDVAEIDEFLQTWRGEGGESRRWVTMAPGSRYATKRWPVTHFLGLARLLLDAGWDVALVGGVQDRPLCDQITGATGTRRVLNAAGSLSMLQSAELIRRSDLLVSNDSAPMHLAVAMRVPVVALFGATVPAFGFAPRGTNDVIVERQDLPCRPCNPRGRTGGTKCPIGTFDCMIRIRPEEVFRSMEPLLAQTPKR